ncbi:hypothetical protein HDU76_006779 [Blyttiomyces sp. JEL0837]|nr:hypothetical protein HDU76_006779 [Blyttiomyces sp. JEL0837]
MTKSTDVVARLTDTKNFTGSHKERFDESGKGKGLAGREELANFDGSTSSETRDHTITNTVSKGSTKPVVKPKTDSETFGEKAKKIKLFQYADKNHAGESIVLTKAKFPQMKQLSEQTTKFTPPGKPKMILDQSMNEIKSLDQVEDGGKYLVITTFDKAKLDDSKIPKAFRE